VPQIKPAQLAAWLSIARYDIHGRTYSRGYNGLMW